MPKKVAAVEVNNFVGGLVADASPLTFPDNASLDEDNFILDVDGSRRRRLGMDFETGAQEITTTTTYSTGSVPAHSSFRWENAAGVSGKNLLVVQFGTEIKFFDLDNEVLSSSVLYTHDFTSADITTVFSYAVVDGLLVVATGEKEINIFEFDGTTTITNSKQTLLIRDFFGLDVEIGGEDLHEGNNVSLRPASKTDEHIYNLRNQTWADPKKPGNGETLTDPIKTFFDGTSKYPSNADSLVQSLYPDANDTDDRVGDRFWYEDLEANPEGSTQAPTGHYIIDALERGSSRLEAIQKTENAADASANMITVTTLPSDTTPGGASVVAQYAGRVWYAGFQGDVTGGDSKSPRMSSYILFSQVVKDPSTVARCYQEGDPTSRTEPEILDTDGGFIRIDDAYGIKALYSVSNSLFVLAENGIWRIEGDDGQTFRATGYSVPKVSDRGIRGSRSIVEVSGSLIYWGDEGIYAISRDQFGDWTNNSIVENRIQSFYNDIGSVDKESVQGYYDAYDKKARWIYRNDMGSTEYVRELILDKNLNAFYTNTIYTLNEGDAYPKVVGIYETNPFRVSPGVDDVVVNGAQVQVNTEDVTTATTVRTSATRQIAYITVTGISPTITYKFSNYTDTTFHDWYSIDNVGVDAAAYLITGYLTGGTFQRDKQVTYLTTFLRKTEDGYTISGDDFTPTNQSSCKVQFQWDWTNNANSNRWSTEREFYRPRRHYSPVDVNDGFSDGEAVVASKDKIRGQGRAFTVKFSTTESKDLHLYGWSMFVGLQQNA